MFEAESSRGSMGAERWNCDQIDSEFSALRCVSIGLELGCQCSLPLPNIANILVNTAKKSIVHAQSFVKIHNSYAPSLPDNLNKNPMNRLIERQRKLG